MTSLETGSTVDAFTAEVIRSAVVAITREMKTNLMPGEGGGEGPWTKAEAPLP
jgi:hypothetical protein